MAPGRYELVKYRLNIRSRPSADEPVGPRHDRLVTVLRRLPQPWGLTGEVLSAKEPGSQFISIVQLTSNLGKGVRGSVTYANRACLSDEGIADDYLLMDFDPVRVDYALLVGSAFQALVDAVGAYTGQVQDEEFLFKSPYGKADTRDDVTDIRPLHYIDKTLCQRAFALTPSGVAKTLKEHVAKVEAMRSGLLIVVTSEALPFPAMKKLCRPLRGLLPSAGAKRKPAK